MPSSTYLRTVAAMFVAALTAAVVLLVGPASAATPVISLTTVAPNPVAPGAPITLAATVTDPTMPTAGAKVVFCFADPNYATCDVQQNNTLAETFVDGSGAARGTSAIQTAGTYDVYATYYGIDSSGTITGYDSNHVSLVVGSAPTLYIGDVAVREGNNRLGNLAFLRVTLSAVATTTVTATAVTTNSSARAGSDYLAAPFPVRLTPGHTTAYVVVLILGDRIREPDETFTVSLTDISGAIAGRNPAVGTIVNDD